jgi:hypothetical protein
VPAGGATSLATPDLRSFAQKGELIARVCLAALAVFICYRFEWAFLRFATSDAVLHVWSLAGRSAHRVSFDTIELDGERFYYGIGCAFADVFCACVPLLWNLRKTVRWNLLTLAGFGAALFALNVLRALLTHALCAAGAPLIWPDLGLGALAYLAVWRWVVRQGAWRLPASGTAP